MARDEHDESPLTRREWMVLTGVGAPAMLAGCADDGVAGEGGETGEETETGDSLGDGDGDPAGDGDGDPMGDGDGDGDPTGDGDGDPAGDGDGDVSEVWEPEAIPESLELFPRTVMAGDMSSEAFTVACYIADASAKTLRVWLPGELPGEVLIVDERELVPDEDGFAKTRIESLEAGTWYRYAVLAGEAPEFDARSLIGMIKTALAPGQIEPVTLAFGSCIGTGGVVPDFIDPDDPFPREWPMTDMAESLEFDLFVHLGDQGYMDTVWSAGGSYEQYLAAGGACHGGGYRKLFPKAGLLSTWDDHEVVDNGTVDPWTEDLGERARIDSAKRAYYRVMPINADNPNATPIWRSVQWGEVVEVLILDTRYERQPAPTLSFMSTEQRAWLLGRLIASPCRFVCVCSPKPYSFIKMLIGDYPGQEERWSGHPVDRQMIKDVVNDNGLDHIIWVTGDIHMSYVGRADRDDDSTAGNMTEVCCTIGNTNPLGETLDPAQFDYFTSGTRMPVITFDSAADEVLIQMYDAEGELRFEKTLSW